MTANINTSANSTIAAYVEAFERNYGEGRIKTKPAYRNGDFVGYNVRIDDGAWNLMTHLDIEDAIVQFNK